MTVFTIGLSAILAMTYDQEVALAAFSAMTVLAATASCLFAFIGGQRLFAPRLTLWDQAAILAFVGVAAELYVDRDAVAAFLEANAADAPAERPTPATAFAE